MDIVYLGNIQSSFYTRLWMIACHVYESLFMVNKSDIAVVIHSMRCYVCHAKKQKWAA